MRLTLSQALPSVAAIIGQNQNSVRVLDYLNRGQEELLAKGRWVGTRLRYRVCVTGDSITWPREVETIEAMTASGYTIQLHNQWYEFQEFTPYGDGTNFNNFYQYPRGIMVDKGDAISFDDLCGAGNPKRLKVYATSQEDVDSRILLQFYDCAGNYVRSNDPVEGWLDGEFVGINATTPQQTINVVGNWVGVQKPITNGFIRIHELDTVTGLERVLAVYQPDEINPTYRRSKVPNVLLNSQNKNGSATVDVIGSARFIPALKPRDYLIIQSVSAIAQMALSIYRRENNQDQMAMAAEAMAVKILDEQLEKWIGTGAQTIVNFQMASGAGNFQSNFV